MLGGWGGLCLLTSTDGSRLRRMAPALRTAAMRGSPRYLFPWIVGGMLLRAARAFLLMVVSTCEAAGFRGRISDDHHAFAAAAGPTPTVWQYESARCRGRSCGPSGLGLGAVRLLVSRDWKAIPYGHPLQMWRQLLSVQQPETRRADFRHFPSGPRRKPALLDQELESYLSISWAYVKVLPRKL